MKRPLDVDLELESDRISYCGPTRTEKYIQKLEKDIQKMEAQLEQAKRLYKSGRWTSYGNIINSG